MVFQEGISIQKREKHLDIFAQKGKNTRYLEYVIGIKCVCRFTLFDCVARWLEANT